MIGVDCVPVQDPGTLWDAQGREHSESAGRSLSEHHLAPGISS